MSVFQRKSLLSVSVLICFLSFWGCNKNPAAPTAGSIQGLVTNATGDTLISGATISTTPPTSAVSTDAQGKYTIPNVSPGEYTVAATKNGYNPCSVAIMVVAGQATIANAHLGENNPPAVPTLISPLNNTVNQPTTIILSWFCSDPDGDSLSYDVYLGRTTPPTPIVLTAQNGTSIAESGLDSSSTYYWRIVAKDNRGASTSSEIWSFTTLNKKPLFLPETLAVQLGLVRPIVVIDIPAGTFSMGDTAPSISFPDTPVHQVTLSAFALQETEVTQEQYLAVMDTNPAKFKGDLRRPVETVNWEDAVKFCNTLSKLCGLDTVYDIKTWGADFTKKGFRLPTEAEYEYALRGGTTTKYWWGSDTNGIGASAWYFMNTGGTTYPVATKLPNGYKLYDMTGNVDEWCYDWRGPYTKDAAIDPIGPATGTYRILRGDSWTGWDGNIVAANCSAFRTSDNQYVRFPVFGFRVALSR